MTTTNEFESATATVARTFSRESEVRVVFAGDSAKTAKGVVVLPKLPEGATLTREQVDTTRGYVDHEVGHQLMTPMDGRGLTRATKFVKAMANAIEDIRVEQGLAKMYPAMKDNLRVTSSFVNRSVGAEMDADPDPYKDWKRVLPLVTTWAGRSLMGYGSGEAELLDKLEPDIRNMAFEVAKEALKIDSGVDEFGALSQERAYAAHEDVLSLAKKWGRKAEAERRKEEEEEAKAEEPPPPAPPMGGSPGEPGGAPGMPGPGSSPGEPGSEPAPAPSTAPEPTTGSSASAKRAPIEPIEGGLERALEAISTDKFEPEFVRGVYRPYTRAWDRVMHRTTPLDSWDDEWTTVYMQHMRMPSGGERYMTVRSSVSSHLMAMRRKLERALMARKDVQWVGGYSHGSRVDLRRCVDIARGVDPSWRRRVADENLDAAVSILVDLSGSMHGTKARLAQITALALGEALDLASVPFEVVGFHNPVYGDDGTEFVIGGPMRTMMKRAITEMRADKRKWGRVIPFAMPVFKKFEEPMRMARSAIGNMPDLAGGGNSDCDGLLYAGQRLMRRHENTRILFVLSDGRPSVDGWGDSSQLPGEMIRQVQRMEANGIKCVGIGIMDHSVERFYPRHVVVNNVADLAGQATDLLGKVLLGEGFRADTRALLAA